MSENANDMIQTDTAHEDVRETASAGRHAREEADSAGAQDASAAQRVVPVAEAKKYRKRAQQAEQSLEEMQRELQDKSQRVTELEQAVSELERRSTIDQLLIESEAIDLEAARLLTETAVRAMDEPDAAAAVEELRRTKPYLFRSNVRQARTMSARRDASDDRNDALDHAAAEAHATGDRNDLLRYLRLRRKRS